MYKGSVTEEAREVLRAIELIQLGARMPVLEKELTLSRNRLIRLYRELKNASPPKGMLPFSADWYFTWLPNIHASLFYNIYLFLTDRAKCSRLDALTRAYRLYLEHCESAETERVLSFTRAWTLLRFFEGGLLTLSSCTVCSGRFVRHVRDAHKPTACCICMPPARAGMTRAARASRTTETDAPAATSATRGRAAAALGELSGTMRETMRDTLADVTRALDPKRSANRLRLVASVPV
ncbi:flagellar transcriptional regulator FlhC [Paraburkholderia sp. CNPSo 3281]|uniref:flagellar transcriptional regulator FlhC n=1 Tax=Paraburkholderia sp. CNPSo 3281 TaxID=2940933 RepID=UPI0020B8CC34|nr:flagellar transcriptional regulator FlhC [Paraburkholderia sp. CNPSo 3281]MCP3716196.1 flagellar transcriptional regulator FlhC [Paraburkholderia sp. CNPSo 3281]